MGRIILKHLYKAFSAMALVGLALAWTMAPSARASQESGLRMVDADEQGVTMELVASEFFIEEGQAEDQPCQTIRVEGYTTTSKPDHPELPLRGALVGIPPDSNPTLTVVETSPGVVIGRFHMCPSTSPILEDDLIGQMAYRGEERRRNPEAYARDGFIPEKPAELVMTGFLRSQRIAKVLFQPFQYNPASGELRFFKTIRIRIAFGNQEKIEQVAEEEDGNSMSEGQFEKLLQDNLLNYEIARQWRSYPSPKSLPSQAIEVSQANISSYKILVNQDGIYQVTYEDLVAAGADMANVDPRTFRLYKGGDYRYGEEIAIQVAGQEDHVFQPGDRIIFYGQKVDTRYTDQNAYFLTWGDFNGRRMFSLDGTPGSGSLTDRFLATQHAEENRLYMTAYPSGENNDVWYWDYVYAQPGPASKSFIVPCTHLSTSPGLTASLRGLLKGYLVEGSMPEPKHHTRIYVNGNLVDEHQWPFRAQYSFEVDIPQIYLSEGNNIIRVEIPSDSGISRDIVLVNWFEIDAWKTFLSENDRLDFAALESVSGDQVGSTEPVLDANQVARSAMQFQVTEFSTNTLEVFDITDPTEAAQVYPVKVALDGTKYTLTFEQIVSGKHRYIAQSLANRLSPVAIVKDQISELHSTLNAADYILITHTDFYTEVVPLADYHTSQGLRTKLVKVEDIYDEFNGGVVDAQAIQVFLAYAYEHWQPPSPLYVLLVGDGNFDPRNYYATGEPNWIPTYLEQVDPWLGQVSAENRFVTVSGADNLPDMYIGRLPARTSAQASAMVEKVLAYEQNSTMVDLNDWRRETLFVADEYDPDVGDFASYSDSVADGYLPSGYNVQKVYYKVTHADKSAVQSAIVEAINQGRLLVNYIGHGSVQTWGLDTLFSVSLVDSLINTEKLPFMVPMTCLEGAFDYPSPPGRDNSSLAERLVREIGKGAIASFSPISFGVTKGHDFLNKGLYEAIFTHHLTQLGPATMQSKLYLFANSSGQYLDLIDTYALLGDPALRLGLIYHSYIPFVTKD